MVKKGRLVGCQARSERLNVYVIQMFGPDQAARDTTGSHDWAKPFTWCDPMRARGAACWPMGRENPQPSCSQVESPYTPVAVEVHVNPNHPSTSPDRRPSFQAEHGVPGACRVAALLLSGQGGGVAARACMPAT